MIHCGLIGYGAWGAHHARVIAGNPDATLAAIAVPSDATRTKAKHEHPASSVYGDYREMLTKEDLDAVAVVVPSHLHFQIGRAVLESSRHLLIEKPMCLSVADCEALNALAKSRGRVLAVGHEMRHSSLWSKAKELVDAGALGQPLYALIELWRKPYRLGADGWRYDVGRVGNWILEEPIHFFDLARWYFERYAAPVSVAARANSARADQPGLQDHFSAIVNFSSGAYAVISQCLGGWEHHQTVKMAGTEGALWASWSGVTDRTFAPSYSLKVRRGDAMQDVPIPKAAGEVFELEDQFARFVGAIEAGSAPAATGADGAWSVRLCLKAQESVEKGVAIAV